VSSNTFRGTTRPRLVEWTDRFVQPPTHLYVDRDDKLLIMSWGTGPSVELAVRGRFLTPAGKVHTLHFRHTPLTNRTVKHTTHELQEGFILGLTATDEIGGGHYGDTFVEVGLLRGGLAEYHRTQSLIRGYVGGAASKSWPYGHPRGSLDGPGAIYNKTGTNPPAGAQISETVPTNARWRLKLMSFTLNADAAGANRRVAIVFDSGAGGSVFYRNYCASEQAPGAVTRYDIAHLGWGQTTISGINAINMPPNIILPQGYRIRTAVNNFVGTDNFSEPQMLIEEWLEE